MMRHMMRLGLAVVVAFVAASTTVEAHGFKAKAGCGGGHGLFGGGFLSGLCGKHAEPVCYAPAPVCAPAPICAPAPVYQPAVYYPPVYAPAPSSQAVFLPSAQYPTGQGEAGQLAPAQDNTDSTTPPEVPTNEDKPAAADNAPNAAVNETPAVEPATIDNTPPPADPAMEAAPPAPATEDVPAAPTPAPEFAPAIESEMPAAPGADSIPSLPDAAPEAPSVEVPAPASIP